MSETCRGHLWEKIIVKLFASSWYIFLTYIYDARSHLYQNRWLYISFLPTFLLYKKSVSTLNHCVNMTIIFRTYSSKVKQEQQIFMCFIENKIHHLLLMICSESVIQFPSSMTNCKFEEQDHHISSFHTVDGNVNHNTAAQIRKQCNKWHG